MSTYLRRISSTSDFSGVGEAIDYFEKEFPIYADKIESAKGRRILAVAAEIPDMTMKVHDRWSELNCIYDLLDVRKQAVLGERRRYYGEKYAKELSGVQVERYAESDQKVLDICEVMIDIDLLRRRWEGLSKAVEKLHQQVRIIADLRKAGLDDYTI